VLQARLAVAGAFHTQYMAPAAEKLQEALNNTNIVTPRIPVISNVDAQPHSDPATIKAILVKQVGGLASPLSSQKCICASNMHGVQRVPCDTQVVRI
jgi:[acyl-carrier-protein] S-malonyltransferase